MKIAILGDTGMLGQMVKGELRAEGFEVVGFNRSNGLNIEHDSKKTNYDKLCSLIPDNVTYVINCMGAIKPQFNKSPINSIFINAVFPHQLAQWAQEQTTWGNVKKVFHITTDCVFDGNDGWYTDYFPHNTLDEYGKSKSLGEPSNCMVLRTSIIGPEWGGNNRSLVEWLLSCEGQTINGFTNHIWNGLTTLELAKSIGKIISGDLYKEDKFNLFSTDINKYELLNLMVDEWCLDIKVNPVEADNYCNRTLRTTKPLNSMLHHPNIQTMIRDLTKFIDMDRECFI